MSSFLWDERCVIRTLLTGGFAMEWFFTTRAGMLALCGIGLVVFALLAVLLEGRTKKLYPEHERTIFPEDSVFSIFNPDEDEEKEKAKMDAELAEAAKLRAQNKARAEAAAKAKAAAQAKAAAAPAKPAATPAAAKTGTEEIHEAVVSFRESLDDWDPNKD